MKIAPQEEHWYSYHSSFTHASDEFGICNVIEMWFPARSNTSSAVLLYYNMVMISTTSPVLSNHFDSLRIWSLGSRVAGMAQWSECSPPLNEALVRAICGVHLLVLALLWGFAPDSPVFLPPQKPTLKKFQFDQDGGPTWKPAYDAS